jgi:hypothetical protein
MQYRGKFQKERECHGHYDLRTAEEEEETKALEYNAVMEQQENIQQQQMTKRSTKSWSSSSAPPEDCNAAALLPVLKTKPYKVFQKTRHSSLTTAKLLPFHSPQETDQSFVLFITGLVGFCMGST